MARRILLLVAAFLLLAPVLAANSAQAAGTQASFFGTSVSQGDSLSSLDMGNNLTLKNVSVSSVTTAGGGSTSTISATGSLYIGSDTSPLSVSVSYANTTTRTLGIPRTNGSWSIAIAKNSAGSGYVPRSGSGVNLNGLSGTLAGSLPNGSVSSGSLQASLTITGVSYGGAMYNGTAAVSSTGIQATVAVDDLTVNGTSVGSLNITASSTSNAVSASVTFGTSGSTVNAALSYTDSKNWSVTLAGNGGGAARWGAPINFNNVSGTISETKGALSAALNVTGVTVGSATFDAALTLSSVGFTASATVDTVTLASGYTIQNASITVSTVSNTASISGSLVANPSSVSVSASYTDANDWSISVAANSAGAGYAAPNSTTLDINDISGTINDVKGNISSALMASGVALGDGTFDMVATFNPDGTFTASAAGQSLTIGGMLLNSAAITLSTASPTADITADFTTDAGTFSFDIGATGISGGGYSLHIAGSAADLAVSSTSSKFAMQSFGFDTTVDVPATGCISWDAAVNGSLLMRGDTYTLNKAEIAFSCNTLTKFVFSISVTHKTSDIKQMTVTLTINWFSTHGSYTPTFGTKSQYTSKAPYSGTTTHYYSGFFGTADVSYLYAFEKGSFNKHVTFGLGFSVAVYQQLVKTTTPSSVTDPTTSGCTALNPCYSAGAWDVAIGAMGYFDADERINGDILCNLNVAPSNDFVCRGSMYVNPSNAGSYHEPIHNI